MRLSPMERPLQWGHAALLCSRELCLHPMRTWWASDVRRWGRPSSYCTVSRPKQGTSCYRHFRDFQRFASSSRVGTFCLLTPKSRWRGSSWETAFSVHSTGQPSIPRPPKSLLPLMHTVLLQGRCDQSIFSLTFSAPTRSHCLLLHFLQVSANLLGEIVTPHPKTFSSSPSLFFYSFSLSEVLLFHLSSCL